MNKTVKIEVPTGVERVEGIQYVEAPKPEKVNGNTCLWGGILGGICAAIALTKYNKYKSQKETMNTLKYTCYDHDGNATVYEHGVPR